MKTPKKQTKKQPINVQLSKNDLKELLVVLKDLIRNSSENAKRIAEIVDRENRNATTISNNLSKMDMRITTLEIVEESHSKEIHKLKQHCLHDDKFDRVEYYTFIEGFSAAIYKCERCGREDRKAWSGLSRKEKKGIKLLGIKI
jgi:hypothetical protein